MWHVMSLAEHPSLPVHAGLDGRGHGMGLTRRDGVLFPGIGDFHRLARLPREEGADHVRGRDLRASPEGPADGDLPHPHLVEGHFEAVRERFCLQVGPGVGHPDFEVARVVELRDHRVWLRLEVGLLGRAERILPHVVGCGEALLHVAHVDLHMDVYVAGVALVDEHRAGLHGLIDGEDGGQLLVLHA